MRIAEFQIRAWQYDGSQAQVLVHSSPVGDIRKPITVPCDVHGLDEARRVFQSGWFSDPDTESRLIALGRQLAGVLLPRPVYALLTSSLLSLGPEDTLRIRLCLDPGLIDLPWEYLYRPDLEEAASVPGFLLFDHRISLVREAPLTEGSAPALPQEQRMLFAGALWCAGRERWDYWGVQDEYNRLAESLEPVQGLLGLQFLDASEDIEAALSRPTAVFHYSGHTDTDGGSAYLVRQVRAQSRGTSQVQSVDRMYSFEMANMLQRAGTRLAVFSACNSGRWAFVDPLLRAGLPALIGAQGIVSVRGANTFCESLYSRLAVGLSLDEALAGARFQLLKEGGFGGRESLEWGVFMAYLPVAEAVLLPRTVEQPGVSGFQQAARERTQQALSAVTGRIGAAPPSASAIDRTSLRKAILQKFSVDEEELLCADIKQSLADGGVALELDLDILGGRAQGEEALLLKLIDFLDRRGFLPYLVDAVRRERPGIV